MAEPADRRTVHSLVVRVTHWLNAFAIGCMVASGWAVYNASPIFPFRFPAQLTLGGWLGGSIAWHFAAMWLLVGNGLLYAAYGLASGHWRRRLLPIRPDEVLLTTRLALRGELPHEPGLYNAVQRLLYAAVLALGVLVVASGLAIWKPVQWAGLTELFGGFDVARIVHFVAMAGIVGFVVLHVSMVLLEPRCLLPMITGRSRGTRRASA